jgi:hypothetical protein
MEFEKFTDRAKEFLQSVQTMVLRRATIHPPMWRNPPICSIAKGI